MIPPWAILACYLTMLAVGYWGPKLRFKEKPMDWLTFQLYRLGWKWPYIQWRIWRFEK